jgi:enoyl-CoA hydratase/carnithine racemase
MTANDLLLRSDAEGITTLTLNRPAQRNALSVALMEAMVAELDKIAADESVRVVIITGAGPSFCSGHDLRELRSDPSRAFYEKVFGLCATMMQRIVALPQPVIASVQGVATAAGCQLVATCDLAVASETARFATPGVHIGLFCSTPMVALSRNVSNKHAMEMLLTGEMVSADDAYRIGLVNRVVPAGEASETALELAKTIASKSAYTVKIGKQAFYRQRELDLAGAYKLTADVMVENMMAPDAEEGIGAFIEKRDPRWQDR